MKHFLLALLFSLYGCQSDQMLVHEKIVEIEVPVEVVVEVPVEVATPIEEAEIWIDSFIQVSAVDGVDIIWVIDTSGSMQAYQSQLLGGISQMMTALPATGWRLVMIPADPASASTEQQFPLVTGDTIQDAEDMYNLMNTGSDEAGFDSIVSYIQDNPYAATWMRSDAALLIIFVSDEDDQSSIMGTVNEFVTWYLSRRFGNVFLASIVMQESGVSLCSDISPSSSVGERYMEATNLLFGTVVDICSEDWTAGVTDAASQIEPYESLELTHIPIEETIHVFVGGGLYWDWTYDDQNNTINFTVTPPGGQLVEVGYVIKP
jgi:hypothetical protein